MHVWMVEIQDKRHGKWDPFYEAFVSRKIARRAIEGHKGEDAQYGFTDYIYRARKYVPEGEK